MPPSISIVPVVAVLTILFLLSITNEVPMEDSDTADGVDHSETSMQSESLTLFSVSPSSALDGVTALSSRSPFWVRFQTACCSAASCDSLSQISTQKQR